MLPFPSNIDCDESAEDTAHTEQRSEQRLQLLSLYRVIPLDANGNQLPSEAFAAIGKDVSQSGIGLIHQFQLKRSRVLIKSTRTALPKFTAEAEVSWSRPVETGGYTTGFRFLRDIG